MPTRDTAPAGAPCWVDLLTSDPERSRDFYGQVFGWTATDPGEQFGGYFNFSKDGVLVAGGMPRQPGVEAPETWTVYLATDNAQKTLEAATAHGGQILLPAMAVADLGTMAMVADAGGAAIGLWQPGTHKGFGVFGETGTPAWFEVHTRDYPATIAFYRDVFGWDTQTMADTPEFRYTVMQHGEEQLAGIMDASGFLPEGVPAHWSVYFGTADTDKSVDLATSNGGQVIRPAADSPYGRMAVVADQHGAVFSLISTPAED